MDEKVENSVYKAPEAELETAENKTEFFIVSTKKLWIMSLVTMGVYGVYWNYKHWRNYKYYDDVVAPIWPVPRAIFSVFFVSSLFGLIAESYKNQSDKDWNSSKSAGIYILMVVFNIVFAVLGSGETRQDLIFQWLQIILIPLGLTYAMASAQAKANIACLEPNGDSNSKIGIANILWIVFFILYWLLILLGSYMIFYGIE